jgi:transcriptional regulator with XRE-family HTH domain
MAESRKTEGDASTTDGRRDRIYAGLGSRLRVARERKGMTVRGLARYVGVSPSLVSQIERGRVMPSVGTLYALTNELGLVVDDLFKGSPSKSKGRERAPDTEPSFIDIQNLFNAYYIADNSGFNPPLQGTPFTIFAGLRARF